MGSNFHRSCHERVIVTTPALPLYTSHVLMFTATDVQAIQICRATVVVPPASLEPICTAAPVTGPPVIVPITRAERHAIIISERIS